MRSLLFGALVALAVAVPAAGAQANENAKFTAASYPATIHGEDSGTHQFSAAGGTMNCSSATFTGSMTEASRTQTITPSYSGCTSFGFIGATVTMNGCDYLDHITGTGTGGQYAVTTDLVCPTGKEVVIDSGPCTIRIPAQNGLEHKTIPINITINIPININIGGIHGTLVKNNFLCFFTAGEFTNGTYAGSLLLSGRNSEGNPQSIDVG